MTYFEELITAQRPEERRNSRWRRLIPAGGSSQEDVRILRSLTDAAVVVGELLVQHVPELASGELEIVAIARTSREQHRIRPSFALVLGT